jgi:lipoyl(octanoyl) transferase
VVKKPCGLAKNKLERSSIISTKLKTLELIDAGITDYHKAWEFQKKIFNQVVNDRSENYLILTEHNPVITIGKTGSFKNLLTEPAHLKSRGIKIIEIDRGGDITFHGPGQIVGYPILDLFQFKKDIHWYLRNLEEVIIQTLRDFNIEGGRIPDFTGVWVKKKKICAIGVKVTRWVTMHGFALNVSTNLDYFNHIIPCGISDHGVTSIFDQIGNISDQKDVIKSLYHNFAEVFDIQQVTKRQSTDSSILKM